MKRLVQIPTKHLRKAYRAGHNELNEIEDFKKRFIALLDWVKEDKQQEQLPLFPEQSMKMRAGK